jgi:hypothetical protein
MDLPETESADQVQARVSYDKQTELQKHANNPTHIVLKDLVIQPLAATVAVTTGFLTATFQGKSLDCHKRRPA